MKNSRNRRWVALGLCSVGVLMASVVVFLVFKRNQPLDLPGKSIAPISPSVYEPWLERAHEAWQAGDEDMFVRKAKEYGLLCRAGQFEAAEALRTALTAEQVDRLLTIQAKVRCDLGDLAGALRAVRQIRTPKVSDRARHQMALFYLPEHMLDTSLALAAEIKKPPLRCGALLLLAKRAAQQGDLSRARQILAQCDQNARPKAYGRTERLLACFEALLTQNANVDELLKSLRQDDLYALCRWLGDRGAFENGLKVASDVPLTLRITALTGLARDAHRRNNAEWTRRFILQAEESAREFQRLKLARAPEARAWCNFPKDYLGGVVLAMAEVGMKDEAVRLADELRDSPDTFRNNRSCVVSAYLLCGKTDAAASYERLHPNSFTTRAMIDHYADKGDLEAATRLIENCEDPDIRADAYMRVARHLIERARK